MDIRGLNLVSFVAAGLFFASVLYPWWGIDINGPSYGISYSFRWTMWAGPLTNLAPGNAYSQVNNLSQILTSGTAIVGTLALETGLLALVGMNSKLHRLLEVGLALSFLAIIAYFVTVVNGLVAWHYAWPTGCINNGVNTGVSGTCNDGPPPVITLTWGFQPGYYLCIAGLIALVLAREYDSRVLRPKSTTPAVA